MISHGGSKDLETLRGTLAHLGYVDPATVTSKKDYYANHPSLYTIPDHISRQITKHVSPIVSPITTPVKAAIEKTIRTPLEQFFGPGDKSKTPGIQLHDPRGPKMGREVINPVTSLPRSAFKSGGFKGRPTLPALPAPKPVPVPVSPSRPKPVPVTRTPLRGSAGTDRLTYDPSLETDPGTEGDDYSDPGYGKIICTMMNRMYGLGEYRIKQWLLYSKRHLTEEHQLGYHKLYCRLVSKMPSNKLVARVLSHLADRRTNDIVAEMKGTKRDQLGRLYRAILIDKPSYLVGSMIKRNWLKPADISVLQKG